MNKVNSAQNSGYTATSSAQNGSELENKMCSAHSIKPFPNTDDCLSFGAEWVRNPGGSPLLDHKKQPIAVSKMLSTKPLRNELARRPGPGNKKITYMSGDSVTRTLNDIFGFDGWCMEIKNTNLEERNKNDKGHFYVVYTATVRLTHRRSGAFKEDCGSGDAKDKTLGTAVGNALKASVTDAVKRAARHFGDKLGNSLYQGNFSVTNAPVSLKDALDAYDIDRANSKFGFNKEKATTAQHVDTTSVMIKKEPNVNRNATTSVPREMYQNEVSISSFRRKDASVQMSNPCDTGKIELREEKIQKLKNINSSLAQKLDTESFNKENLFADSPSRLQQKYTHPTSSIQNMCNEKILQPNIQGKNSLVLSNRFVGSSPSNNCSTPTTKKLSGINCSSVYDEHASNIISSLDQVSKPLLDSTNAQNNTSSDTAKTSASIGRSPVFIRSVIPGQQNQFNENFSLKRPFLRSFAPEISAKKVATTMSINPYQK